MFTNIRKYTAHLYDLFISNFLTVTSHVLMLQHLIFRPSDKNFLDIGVGTGKPLKTIAPSLPSSLNVTAVDINQAYVAACKQNFKGNSRFNIHLLSFYDIKTVSKTLYDVVFFSFSFMLMPDKPQALELAKQILAKPSSGTPGGRIAFLLTLNRTRNALFEKAKPLIKKFTSVDFGSVVYEDDFLRLLDNSGLDVTRKVRLTSTFNPLFWIFPIHYVEAFPRQ